MNKNPNNYSLPEMNHKCDTTRITRETNFQSTCFEKSYGVVDANVSPRIIIDSQ